LPLNVFFDFLMCVKELPNESRDFFGDFVKVCACGFGILVQGHALLDSSYCGKRQRDRLDFTFLEL
jgi:hypothetical protein